MLWKNDAVRNLFVVIEGLDGVGKSTIVRELARALNARGRPCLAVKSPVGGYDRAAPYVSRRCDVTSKYLFYLSGVKHTSERIRGLLQKYSVVCDRWVYTTQAYHIAQGVPHVCDVAGMDLLVPDHAFYLKVTDERVRRSRLLGRGVLKPGDEVVWQPGGLLERIEGLLLANDMHVVDTTHLSVDETVASLLGCLG